MKFKAFFAWYDFWIGAYYDVGHHTLYICPLPMCVLRFEFSGPKDELKHRQDRAQYGEPPKCIWVAPIWLHYYPDRYQKLSDDDIEYQRVRQTQKVTK